MAVDKFREIVGYTIFGTIKMYCESKQNVGYVINVTWQIAYMVANPISVGNILSLFNCTTMSRVSDRMSTLFQSVFE